MARNDNAGITLVEVVIAIAILAIGLITILQVIVSSAVNTSLSRQRSQAIQHAETVLADMRFLRDSGALVPEAIVEAFPPGLVDLPVPDDALPDEVITVSYQDASAAPLFIAIEVQWTGLRGRVLRELICTALENN